MASAEIPETEGQELDDDREPMVRAAEIARQLEPDALELWNLIGSRLVEGRAQYGDLSLDTDERDFAREALEEAADGLAYAGAALVKLCRPATPLEAKGQEYRDQVHAAMGGDRKAALEVLRLWEKERQKAEAEYEKMGASDDYETTWAHIRAINNQIEALGVIHGLDRFAMGWEDQLREGG